MSAQPHSATAETEDDKAIRRLVREYPPLTSSQIERLRAILTRAPKVGGADAS